jgi:hypothetical protein
MTYLASSSSALAAGVAQSAPHGDERLPVPQAALIVVSLSLALWGGIALLVRWAIG